MANVLTGAVKTARLNLTNAGTQTIEAAPGPGYKISVLSFALSSSALTALPQFESASGSNILHGPSQQLTDFRDGGRDVPCFECNVNESLRMTLSGNGTVTGSISYMILGA